MAEYYNPEYGSIRQDLSLIESYIQSQQIKALQYLLQSRGTPVKVIRRRVASQGASSVDPAVQTYGIYSGLSSATPSSVDEDSGEDIVFSAKVLINAETFRFLDNTFANDFERLYSWSMDPIVELDIIQFVRTLDQMEYTFQVTSVEGFGQTQTVMTRFLLSPAPEEWGRSVGSP